MSVSQLNDFDQCCRCCLIKAPQLESLFGVHLDEMLSDILNVKVEINDGYPAQMCVNCIRKMTMAVNFKRLVLASYEKLTEIIKKSNNTLNNNATDDNVIDMSDGEKKKKKKEMKESGGDKKKKKKEKNDLFKQEEQVLTINDINKIDINNYVVAIQPQNNAEVVEQVRHVPNEPGHEYGLLDAMIENALLRSTRTGPYSGHLCPHCGKWFKWRTSLNKHARTHDGRLYRCRVCRNEYADSYYLRIHERKHSSEGGKPFACRLCDSRYADSNSLKRHETRTHPRAASPRGNSDSDLSS